MKALDYIVDKNKRAVWLRAFRRWQHRPYEVAPLSESMHECASCGTAYQGNYCPRCGQSAGVGRFSFKKALLLFLDVWGVGNRSMFRSIRDLMFRPGYMIRDYLRGMQSAYFPPFKMFFLLTAFALLVEHGFSLGLDDKETEAKPPGLPKIEMAERTNADEELTADSAGAKQTSQAEQTTNLAKVKQTTRTGQEEVAGEDDEIRPIIVNGEEVEPPMYYSGMKFAKMMNKLREKNPAIFALLLLVLLSLPLFFFLRKSPAIPDLRYSEFIVTLVYTSNTYSIYSIAGNLLDSGILKFIAVLMVFVTLKQFSGFSKRKLLGYLLLTILISVVVIAVLAGIGIYIIYKNV